VAEKSNSAYTSTPATVADEHTNVAQVRPENESASSNDDSTQASRWGWTAERLVTNSDLQGHNQKELELMRNEIYARHGWIFKRQDLQHYFEQQAWYKSAGLASERDAIDNRISASMSAIEKQNAARILSFEKALETH
jgi:hypothetical protein